MSAATPSPWRVVLALLAVFSAGVYVGSDYQDNVWAKKWSDRNATEAEASRVASEEARTAEHSDQEVASTTADTHWKEEQNGKATTDSTLAGLHDGTLRVREQLTCPPAPPATKANTSPSVAVDSGGGGLRGKDAEFLVRFADQSDTIARDFNYCKAELRRVMSLCEM